MLYIDANIFLRFFDYNSPEFKKLLKSLVELKEFVFVTKQMEDEVERNKLKVFTSSFKEYIKRLHSNVILLPEHLETSSELEIKEWNEKRKEIEAILEKQEAEFKSIANSFIEKIIEGKDEVSQSLSVLFQRSEAASEAVIQLARKRKEMGNPPGYQGDPLGDQISWEQLLNNVKLVDELWVITNDSDFISEFERKVFLNSFLQKELREKNARIKINCFSTLANGLGSFRKSTSLKLDSLPAEKQLDFVAEEETKSNQVQPSYTGSAKFTSSIPMTFSTGNVVAFVYGPTSLGFGSNAILDSGPPMSLGTHELFISNTNAPAGPGNIITTQTTPDDALFSYQNKKVCNECNNIIPEDTVKLDFSNDSYFNPKEVYCPNCKKMVSFRN